MVSCLTSDISATCVPYSFYTRFLALSRVHYPRIIRALSAPIARNCSELLARLRFSCAVLSAQYPRNIRVILALYSFYTRSLALFLRSLALFYPRIIRANCPGLLAPYSLTTGH